MCWKVALKLCTSFQFYQQYMKVLFLHTLTWQLVISFKFKLSLYSLLDAQINLSHCCSITWINNNMVNFLR